MANISEYVKKIRSAIYGRDVRESIAASIEAINKESLSAKESAAESAEKASESAASAKSAATAAAQAKEVAETAAGAALANGAYAKEQGDRAQELIEEIKNTDVGDLAAEVAGMRSAMPGVLIEDIEIPAAGWEEDPTLAAYPYAAVVNMEKATAQMSPVVALKLGSLETARAACLCPSVEAQDGAIKLWAKKTPTADMIATVTLLSEGAVQGSGGESPGGGDYVLPVATRTRLGGVKIGSDVDVAADGTISVNTDEITATDAEVQEMLENTLK